jgi:glucose-6-phosphate 1-dehydrogenase
VLILFGATGDLARRKLLPGLFHLAAAGLMPERYRRGSWGPVGIDQLVALHRWHLPYSLREGRWRDHDGRPA